MSHRLLKGLTVAAEMSTEKGGSFSQIATTELLSLPFFILVLCEKETHMVTL